MDVLEIDAASNNGVDNVRDLRDDAIYTPCRGSASRVYIIDEVHMLSISAFNALLKIIEEPPEHLIFILATTELHKVPATILSRCQRFSFRRISPEDVATRLQYVASQEHISLEPQAAMRSGPNGRRRPPGRRKPFGSVRIRHPRSSNPRGRISMPGPGRRAEGSGVDGRHCRETHPASAGAV